MSDILYMDFETLSICNIKKSGADAYSRHPSTDIMCLGFAFDEGPVELWTPIDGPLDKRIHEHLSAGKKVVGHNIGGFEIPVWAHVGVRKYGFPSLKIEQCYDTMIQAYSMNLPGALADAAPAAGLTEQKDSVGNRIMLQLSQPRQIEENGCVFCAGDGCEECFGTGDGIVWWEQGKAQDKFEKLYAYCKQDIEVERKLYKRLTKLSEKEQKLWVLDHKINQRGVQIDLKDVKTAIQLVKYEKIRLDTEMKRVTGGAVITCTATGQLTDWLKGQLEGVEVNGVTKADVSMLLGEHTLPSRVRSALLLRQEAAKSSTAKLEAMIAGVCRDGRLRGMFQFLGAGATGRWAGRRVQLQNLPRPNLSESEINSVFEILENVK